MTHPLHGKKIPVLDHGHVMLVDHMGDDSAIVQAARASTGKGTKSPEKDRQLIRYMLRNRHTSPFEMVEFKFHARMPIFVARQWVRHRTANINERSGRYSELEHEAYVPETLRVQDKVNKQGSNEAELDNEVAIKRCMKNDQELLFQRYSDNLESGVAKELARINLPLSTYTEWYWKIDLHNLFHFLSLRMHPHAQWEFQQYAKAMYEHFVKPIVPVACEAFEDFVLNAVRFSAQEVRVVRALIEGQILIGTVENALARSELSKKEQEELLQKLQLDA